MATRRKAKPAAILDADWFSAELKKHKIEERDERGELTGWRLSDEGSRFISERMDAIQDAWRPDDISEADQWAEPLRTVVAFRLLVGQFVDLSGNSMARLRDHWKRSKLVNAFAPMADDVAAAMVATNEDPKGLYRALSLCNEADQMRFVDAWRGEILPTLKTVEIKLKNSTKRTATATDKQPEAVAAPAVDGNADNRKATGKAGGRPRKIKRDPNESKVMKRHTAGISFCDIDDELGFELGLSAKLYEAVTRRERRNKPESADKTGRN